jgi:hypothetical protein
MPSCTPTLQWLPSEQQWLDRRNCLHPVRDEQGTGLALVQRALGYNILPMRNLTGRPSARGTTTLCFFMRGSRCRQKPVHRGTEIDGKLTVIDREDQADPLPQTLATAGVRERDGCKRPGKRKGSPKAAPYARVGAPT